MRPTAASRRRLKPLGRSSSVSGRSPVELVGDTDSLLVGLLYSGSYTVDAIENAGVDPVALRRLAAASVGTYDVVEDLDPIRVFFDDIGFQEGIGQRVTDDDGTLETSHILGAALRPEVDSRVIFPFELRRDNSPTSLLKQELEHALCEVLAYLASTIDFQNADLALRSRTHPITEEEDFLLDRELGITHRGMTIEELEFAISALNSWYVNRKVLTEPSGICLQTIARCQSLLFGPSSVRRGRWKSSRH